MPSPAAQLETPCPHCGGSGWRPQAPTEGAAPSLAKVVPCDCRAELLHRYAMLRANIPERFSGKTFHNYRDDALDEHKRESLSLARGAARRFAKDYPALTKTGLLFLGKCGTGKTHLSIAIAKDLIAKGVDVYYCNLTAFLGELRHSYNPATQTTPQKVLARAIAAEVLILDDLGAERLTEWVQETMYHIINQRYQNGYGALIITTNHSFAPPADSEENKARSQLTADLREQQARRATAKETLGDRVGSRIYSRLQELCKIILIDADDFRLTIPKR